MDVKRHSQAKLPESEEEEQHERLVKLLEGRLVKSTIATGRLYRANSKDFGIN